MIGTPFGRYQLLELLGRGGMGEVWRAFDAETNRAVAVKVLSTHLANDSRFEERFRREAHAAAGLNDPHVVPIHNFGEIDGRLYVDMRLIEGHDLQALISDGPLHPSRAIGIIGDVAAALDAAHEVGLFHRDVKPSNILVAKSDFAYLIDFGIARAANEARMTSTGAVIGTWAYLAPERITGADDHRADIYALACVLYACLTGRQPFPGTSMEQQIGGHLALPPPCPSAHDSTLPTKFDDVVAKGMAKNPDDRYSTAGELAREARQALTAPEASSPAETPIPSGTPAGYRPGAETESRSPTSSRFAPTNGKRRWWGIAAATAATIAIVAAAGIANLDHDTPSANGGLASNPSTAQSEPDGPFTGAFRAAFGPVTTTNGGQVDAATTGSSEVRSACRATGCVATATSIGPMVENSPVFDRIGDEWVAVDVIDSTSAPQSFRAVCLQTLTPQLWEVTRLTLQPDGSSLSGDYEIIDPGRSCVSERSVTLTRTGAVDEATTPDPLTQAPRIASPAEALYGRYRVTYNRGTSAPAVHEGPLFTSCLRTGETCVSTFTSEPHDGQRQVLLWADDKWVWTVDQEVSCNVDNARVYLKASAVFRVPSPPQNPIDFLSGRGSDTATGGTGCDGSTDTTTTYERLGN